LNTVVWGCTSRERQASVGDAINELAIIREQLKHPNIVRYFKTFVLGKEIYHLVLLIVEVSAVFGLC
jgi:NIMA (never in mitosis gene a)-related kinase